MTLEGANNAMKRRGKKIMGEVSILERLQNIRAMLVEVRESLGDNSPIEYEAPIDAVSELINDVEAEAKRDVVAVATSVEQSAEEPKAEAVAVVAEAATEEVEPVAEPRRRGRPRKGEPESQGDAQTATRRRTKRAKDDTKELFPFYEQSLF
jgi:hypothetical protein